MEGVVVSAKRADSNITVSVISNAQGRFTIPADRLPPGQYTITTRAVGYDLDGPKQTTIAAGGPTSVDVKLRKTRNLAHQLTNAEWMLSMPGNDEDKLSLINCVSCHTQERIVKSSHNADDFVGVDPDGSFYNKAKMVAGAREAPKYFVSNHLNEMKVRFYGDAAGAQASESRCAAARAFRLGRERGA